MECGNPEFFQADNVLQFAGIWPPPPDARYAAHHDPRLSRFAAKAIQVAFAGRSPPAFSARTRASTLGSQT